MKRKCTAHSLIVVIDMSDIKERLWWFGQYEM